LWYVPSMTIAGWLPNMPSNILKAQLTGSVSQFTLHASLRKGNKPDFHQSASGEKARTFYQTFYDKVGELYTPEKVKNGVFAAMMDVALVNDGPVSGQCRSLTQRLLPPKEPGIRYSAQSVNKTSRSLFRSTRIRPRSKASQVHNKKHMYRWRQSRIAAQLL
jgi:hypothetical protein